MISFDEHTKAAIESVKKGGEILLRGFGKKTFKISSKKEIQNLVTEYDLKSEKTILSMLQKEFPNYATLSEENGDGGNKSPYRWILDPLDGTVNFAHKIPFFCISLALEYRSEILLGVVYFPLLNELFVAEKNKGAFLNHKKIKVSTTKDLNDSFLATGFPYHIAQNPHDAIGKLGKILKRGIPLRRLGSAAMDLAYVACGRFDGFWEADLNLWDVAAGKILVSEAGGKVTKWDGSPLKKEKKLTLIATNGMIHEKMQQVLSGESHDH